MFQMNDSFSVTVIFFFCIKFDHFHIIFIFNLKILLFFNSEKEKK